MNTAPLCFLEFDDVLVETRSHRRTCLRSALESENVILSDSDYDMRCAGLSTPAAARAAFHAAGIPEDETAIELAALRADRAFAAISSNGLPLAPGAGAFVRSAEGFARLGLVTRAARREVDLVLSLAGLGDAFECVVTGEDYVGAEPSPVPFEQAIARMSKRGVAARSTITALVASVNAAASAHAARLQVLFMRRTIHSPAITTDRFIASLEDVRAADVLRSALKENSR